MGQIRFQATNVGTPEKEQWVPVIEIEEDGVTGRFIFDGHYPTQELAGKFIKGFWATLTDKAKQKNFVYSKDGLSLDEMKEKLGKT